jgi:hypothetical protein
MEPLSAHLARRDRGAAVLHIQLRLVTRETHERAFELPAPIRDARTLRTLALLDLESHPPSAAIDRVTVAVDPTPERILQFSLLTRPLPAPEQLSTLLARLSALMGQGRCGSPTEVDSWRPGAGAMRPFAPVDPAAASTSPPATHREDKVAGARSAARNAAMVRDDVWDTVAPTPVIALRRFRLPVPARVRMEADKPLRVTTDRRGLSGGMVSMCAGPWRTSGGWWMPHPVPVPVSTTQQWDRDEWDVTLSDGATYRIFRERDTNAWFIEGIVD